MRITVQEIVYLYNTQTCIREIYSVHLLSTCTAILEICKSPFFTVLVILFSFFISFSTSHLLPKLIITPIASCSKAPYMLAVKVHNIYGLMKYKTEHFTVL